VHKWEKDKTSLVEHKADSEHPFLAEGTTYYELRAINTINNNIEYSVLNLVGSNITLDALFTNGNLDPI